MIARLKPRLAAVLFALLGASVGRADGLVAIAQGPAGPFDVSVLVSASPLRVGRSGWTVVVRDPVGAETALEAEVEIVLHLSGPESHHANASRGVARARALLSASPHRLLHTGWLELATPGIWKGTVHVRGHEGAGQLSVEVPVAPPASPIAQHWRSFALPPVALAVFTLHQVLVRRRTPRPVLGGG